MRFFDMLLGGAIVIIVLVLIDSYRRNTALQANGGIVPMGTAPVPTDRVVSLEGATPVDGGNVYRAVTPSPSIAGWA